MKVISFAGDMKYLRYFTTPKYEQLDHLNHNIKLSFLKWRF